jgi:hypothetical protein
LAFLQELAELDPWNLRGEKAAQEAAQFLGGAPEIKKRDPDSTLLGPEIEEENRAFFEQTFKGWYGEKDAKKASQRMAEFTPPERQNWKEMSQDTDKDRFGEYTMNPDTATLDWESIPTEKIKVVDLSDMRGKPLHEVAEHIVETYSGDYHIPGIEYWKYIIEHPDKAPEDLKDGNYHFFFGSVLRGGGGVWDVPGAGWGGSEFGRGAGSLGDAWASVYRVVLLEK